MILVDTDVMIDLLRQYPPALAWVNTLDDEEVLVPGFVVMELIQGSRNKLEQEKVERTFGGYRVAWPSHAACDDALSVFAARHLSRRIGILDVLIGQTAVALGLSLHTFNEKHYAAVPGLNTVRPYDKTRRTL